MSQFLVEEIARIPAAAPRSPDLLAGLRLSKGVLFTMLWLPLLLAVIVPILFLVVFLNSAEGKLALRATRNVDGRVETVEPARRCRDGVSVTYTFVTPDGVTRRGRDGMCPPNAYATVGIGDSVPVRYVEDEPSINEVARSGSRGAADFLVPVAVIPLFILGIFSVLLWPQIRRRRIDRKLFQTGELGRGRVTFIKSTNEAIRTTAQAYANAEVYVRARFQAGEREVVAFCTNEWLMSHLPPGGEVHVCAVGDKAMLVENYLR